MADLKRTIYELNNRINSVNLEHKYEIENIHRDWSEKYHMALQAHTENDQSHKQKLKTIRYRDNLKSDIKYKLEALNDEDLIQLVASKYYENKVNKKIQIEGCATHMGVQAGVGKNE